MPEIIDVLPDGLIQSAWGNQIRDRAVLRYANAAALFVSEPTPVAGRIAYVDDPGDVVVFNGDTWESLSYDPKTPIVFSLVGSAIVKEGSGRFYALDPVTITEMVLTAGEAPTGADLIIDVNVNGVTIFTNQANRPTVPAGSLIGTPTTPDITEVAAASIITVDIDQTGATDPGVDVTLVIGNI